MNRTFRQQESGDWRDEIQKKECSGDQQPEENQIIGPASRAELPADFSEAIAEKSKPAE